jgi:chromate reductase, NAD(P)H dehydrogenase (quinone)
LGATGLSTGDSFRGLILHSQKRVFLYSPSPCREAFAYDGQFVPFCASSASPEGKRIMAHHIAVVVGSLRRESFNRQLAQAVISLAPADFTFEFIDIGSLPLYSQDYDADYPEVAKHLKQRVEAANGLLFVTPEYNRSMPGVLKNALDWASRPWGTNSWRGKPGAVLGTSVGATGTALAQQHLRNVLAYLDVPTLGQPEMFIKHDPAAINEKGEIVNDGTRKFLQTFVDRYVAWVKLNTAA